AGPQRDGRHVRLGSAGAAPRLRTPREDDPVNSAGKSEGFEALWRESVARAGCRPSGRDLGREEQKALSWRLREDAFRYGDEGPIAERWIRGGLYGSPKSSRRPGSSPG